jgi:release factor glutamine methyltransferase
MHAGRHDVVRELRAAGCVYAEAEAALLAEASDSDADLERLVARRVAGEPVEHIVGWAEFCGLRVRVDPGTFVPRRRTELVVREASNHVRSDAVVVDLCCGTGAIGLALATRTPGLTVHACDIDPAAARCAERNLASVPGEVYVGDLFQALPSRLRGRIDVLAVNSPYVPAAAIDLMPTEARDHEPRIALDGGPDGVNIQRRILAAASDWLRPGGHLVLETSEAQSPVVVDAALRAGLSPRVVRDPDLDATVVVAVNGEMGTAG